MNNKIEKLKEYEIFKHKNKRLRDFTIFETFSNIFIFNKRMNI